jgi:predicted DNA-binding transcriptional regulator AlpA
VQTTERAIFIFARSVILKKEWTELSTTEPKKPSIAAARDAAKLKTARIKRGRRGRQARLEGAKKHREQLALANGHDQHDQLRVDDARAVRLLSKRQVLDIVGCSAVTLWAWMGADPPKFPRARTVVGRSMWVESEVRDWLRTLPPSQLKPSKETEPA